MSFSSPQNVNMTTSSGDQTNSFLTRRLSDHRNSIKHSPRNNGGSPMSRKVTGKDPIRRS